MLRACSSDLIEQAFAAKFKVIISFSFGVERKPVSHDLAYPSVPISILELYPFHNNWGKLHAQATFLNGDRTIELNMSVNEDHL